MICHVLKVFAWTHSPKLLILRRQAYVIGQSTGPMVTWNYSTVPNKLQPSCGHFQSQMILVIGSDWIRLGIISSCKIIMEVVISSFITRLEMQQSMISLS